MPTSKEFAREVEALALTITGYQTGKSGQNGLCDCIGLVMGAMARLGRGSYPMHSTNYFARYQTDNLTAIVSASNLQLGDIVYKFSDDDSELNDRYKPGGRYYTGDPLDYYHIGVVTSTSPLEITHCTSGNGVSGIKRDDSVREWEFFGKVRGVDYAADVNVGHKQEDTALRSIVISPNGKPVNLRPNPGTNKPYIAKVAPGTIVELIESTSEWAHIKLPDGMIGYMMTQFLAPVDNVENAGESSQETAPFTTFEEMVLSKLDELISAVNAIAGGVG